MPFKSIKELTKQNQLRLWDGKIETRAHLAEDIRYNKYGELVITITIPMEEVEQAIEIRRLVGLPIQMTVEMWKPFAEFVRTGEMPEPPHDV